MKLSAKDVAHVAKLSRLSIDEQEIDTFTAQFNDILNYAEILNNLDTTQVQATAQVLPLKNVLRPDVVFASLPNEMALANAPEKLDGCYVVPKVIDN
ncbi:Asp-tRNA(Asn)/Glu-tRNA(Gln) amidotransferase subunit GatC [Succinispira mobilis]|uniref:Asp-tRNA(Asn)/Glu-tRNA(Gln) amidotransferase subunit GatC n=1 Tax=Succinispira mobilis TaxID=78120 RepID=UPI000368CD89|nr:Asp-tRNA(Asn)/Glu-tRNA(Gln) amidotransferase subunit GatC [Succinispira mobilis]